MSALSDGDLARQLKSFGATIGPITDSTRVLYQKKLGKSVAELFFYMYVKYIPSPFLYHS